MKQKTKNIDVGVIVGRFQSYELHEGHKELISFVKKNHHRTVIILGLSPLKTTYRNPLDFQARKQMIQEEFPDIDVLYIKDMSSDTQWSKNLDMIIDDIVGPSCSVALYGSRDSFIDSYKGKYETIALESNVYQSASANRELISKTTQPNKDFRKGVIWATYNRFPTAYTTVDVAIFNETYDKILLGRKAGENKYRLIGGFSDVKSDSFEEDARREVYEETGLEVGNITYVSSILIDDWRYRNEKDKIKTILFTAKVIFGKAEANDDIEEIRWFDFSLICSDDSVIIDAHKPLINILKNKAKGN